MGCFNPVTSIANVNYPVTETIGNVFGNSFFVSKSNYPSLDEGDASQDGTLLESIEETIRSFKASTDSIGKQVASLKQNEHFNTELEQIRDDIYELKMLITSTRDIANEIKVAVNFTDTSFIHLRPASTLKPSMVTSGSLYVQTKEMFAPIAYIHDTDSPSQYMSLHLQNGKPFLQYRLSDKAFTFVSTDVAINDGEWHRVEFRRVGRQATLTVHNAYDEVTGMLLVK